MDIRVPEKYGADFCLMVSTDEFEPFLSYGDYIAVKRCNDLEHSDWGVFKLNGYQVKRVNKSSGICRLESINGNIEPILVGDLLDKITIGKVVYTILRKMQDE